MKYKIFLENGWMGDTLLACNVVKNMTDMGYDVEVFHKWPFMTKFLELFNSNISLFRENVDLEGYKVVSYSGRLDVFDHPLLDYAKSFNIDGLDLDRASKFYPLKESLKEKHGVFHLNEPYITFDNDWHLRTRFNVEHIVNELRKFIQVIPIGGDRFIQDPDPLINTSRVLAKSELHLGMIGGTTNLATFLNTKTIGDSGHLYNFYKTQGETHNYMFKDSLDPEKFLDTFKPFPSYWADEKHIVVHPLATENEFINIVKNNL